MDCANGGVELWGGQECTVARVGDGFIDQIRLAGDGRWPEDLDRFASLGLKALRFPVLWERTAPEAPERRDFAWSDAGLARLRVLGIWPIVGLIHHGSGPAYASLLDPGFPAGLAAHARAVAERYPHVCDYTPVNEPLTTARFSCLYGYWHPHAHDEGTLWGALLNQIDATRLAMRAIRTVNPAARLIATDDLGQTHATDERQGEAAFENDRRWIGWDLMFGRVVPGHALWDRLARHGFADRLRAIADDPCPPDIVGINHYLTSERFLDHRLERYRGHRPCADHARPTISTEMVRVAPERAAGLGSVLRQAWARYGTPMAITEVQNGCTREEQMRWFLRTWRAAEQARMAGMDVRAVTAWSLLGAYGWDRLCTGGGRYESGVFDLRGPAPRETALAPLLRALSQRTTPPHARLLARRGWWEPDASRRQESDAPPILVTGATGTLGQMLGRHARQRGLPCVLTSRAMLDLTDPASIAASLDRHEPWAVINTAGLVDIDLAERRPELSRILNAEAPVRLAEACASRGIRFVTISSDQVFSGTKGSPYVESDLVAPLNAYGRDKAWAERGVLAADPMAFIVRTAAFFSPHDHHNIAAHALDALAAGSRFSAASDGIVSPTYVPDLVQALLDLLIDGEAGIWHLANDGSLSWAQFARCLAAAAGHDPALVDATPSSALGWRAPRPGCVALGSERGVLLPALDDAVGRMVAHYRVPVSGRLAMG